VLRSDQGHARINEFLLGVAVPRWQISLLRRGHDDIH
jgi:hypothetical protein